MFSQVLSGEEFHIKSGLKTLNILSIMLMRTKKGDLSTSKF